MDNKRKVISASIVAILAVSAIVTAVVYCDNIVTNRNPTKAPSPVVNQNNVTSNPNTASPNVIQTNEAPNSSTPSPVSNKDNETPSLLSQISDLKNQLTNVTSIITNLTSANLVTSLGITEVTGNSSNFRGTATPVPYNYLFIQGGVTNTGEGYAYNAGLHVVAYTANGTLEINMTVPLGQSNTYVATTYPNNQPTLSTLHSLEGSSIGITIYTEDLVTNWNVTPVWTNFP